MNTTQGKTGQMTMGPRNGNGVSRHTPLSLEERLANSILPRKAFEVYGQTGETPITCTPEVIEVADTYLDKNGIDKTKKDDKTQWDIFWAREMIAAKIVIADRGITYREDLPGRHFMYDLLADSIISLLNSNGNNGNLNDRRIAEFGGGSGIGLISLAQRGAHVTNLDSSKMALDFSKYLAEHHKVENMLSRIEGNFYDAPFGKDEFDVVYNAGVLEHLDDTQAEKLLSEMTSATKPGGYVVVAIPNENSPFYKGLQKKERDIYKQFRKIFVRLPWEETRRTFDFRQLMGAVDLTFVKEDGLLIPPSEKVKTKDITKEDITIFEKYLSPDPYQSVDSAISNWLGFHGSVDASFRRKYGWSIYAVGQKKAA